MAKGKWTKAQSIERARANTAAIIEYFSGKPGEFYMLKGLLVAEHIDGARPFLAEAYDGLMIAERMDKLQSGTEGA